MSTVIGILTILSGATAVALACTGIWRGWVKVGRGCWRHLVAMSLVRSAVASSILLVAALPMGNLFGTSVGFLMVMTAAAGVLGFVLPLALVQLAWWGRPEARVVLRQRRRIEPVAVQPMPAEDWSLDLEVPELSDKVVVLSASPDWDPFDEAEFDTRLREALAAELLEAGLRAPVGGERGLYDERSIPPLDRGALRERLLERGAASHEADAWAERAVSAG